jgi:hypothetical protein
LTQNFGQDHSQEDYAREIMMDQPKFSIGPYELFSSIIAGAPLLLTGILIYQPISGARDLILTIKDASSIPVAVALILGAYILGGLSSFVTWRYFLLLCRVFKMDFSYLGNMVIKNMAKIKPDLDKARIGSLEFEDRLAVLLLKKVGHIENLNHLDARVTSYLRLHAIQTTLVAESYLAQHIMYRGLSFGFLLLALGLVANIFRTPSVSFEQIMLPFISLVLSLAAFRRAVSFRRWRYREILLSFYHLAFGEQQNQK